MAVTESVWWSEWWDWMVLWLVAAAGVLTLLGGALARFLRRVRRVRRERSVPLPALSPIYLDSEAVMDHYKFGNHTEALTKAVEERRSLTAGIIASLPFISWLSASRESTKEVFVSYVKESEPISVVGLLLSVFRREDALVDVQLLSDGVHVTPNAALTAQLAHGDETGDDFVTLTEIHDFVMVRGRFKAESVSHETLVMRAAYGDGERTAHLRVKLRREGVLAPGRDLPEGQFRAICLGKVTSWDPRTRETLLERPIAVFH
ncbi:hypothetical protein AB0M97_23550 [Streptomyces sp. NPDC051207]|uniref:hypothetical protein n=1 Tax=Streptomyces sp. NPDC051207 TaxID=3154641 RepID=UPI00341CEC9B